MTGSVLVGSLTVMADPVTPDHSRRLATASRRAPEQAAASIDDAEHRELLVADLVTLPA